MPKKSNLEEFTKALYKVWGDRITVAPNAVYVNSITKIDVICHIHGPFKARPDTLLRGVGCPACKNLKRKTTDEFIAEARKVHGEKYDYSKTNYVNACTKVIIICPEHGEFLQEPHSHLRGGGCPECAKIRRAQGDRPMRLTTDEFIRRAKAIHGDEYDYSETIYKNSSTKVLVKCKDGTCKSVYPFAHLHKQPNKISSKSKKQIQPNYMAMQNFIGKATKLYNNKYDYSKVAEEFINMNSYVTIGCPIHGFFRTTPSTHLKGRGCTKCRKEANTQKNKQNFIEKANQVHNNKYDYSKIKYKNYDEKVCIICPEHGEFWQTPKSHVSGQGCPICGRLKANRAISDTTEDFIRKAREVHGDRYDYSKSVYVKNDQPICIICPKHGEFWQIANGHKEGRGCPHCASSNMENSLRLHFLQNNVVFEDYKRFEWLVNDVTNWKLSLDFYLPEHKIGIECQGVQHFESIPFFGGDEGLENRKARDAIKNELCSANGVTLIYYLDAAFNKYLAADDLKANNLEELDSLIEKNKNLV